MKMKEFCEKTLALRHIIKEGKNISAEVQFDSAKFFIRSSSILAEAVLIMHEALNEIQQWPNPMPRGNIVSGSTKEKMFLAEQALAKVEELLK